MDAKDLRKRMEREREFWIDVAPGKRFKFLRPQLDAANNYDRNSMITFADYLRGWDGMLESDFVKGGGSEPVEFDKALGIELLRDHFSWAKKVSQSITEEMAKQMQRTEDVEKNSETSSTSPTG